VKLSEWIDEGQRRARENGGTIVLTRPEYDELAVIGGQRFETLFGYPVQLAKPYDWAEAAEVAS
jgi:hypothetical protein